MPISKDQFFRYKVIDAELRRRDWVTTASLKKIIDDKMMDCVSIRSIQKDINSMKNDTRLGYNAPIEYNRKKRAYAYSDKNYSILHFSLQDQEIHALKFYASCLQIYSDYGLFKDFSNAIQKVINGISIRSALKKETDPELIIQTDTILDSPGNQYLEQIVQAIDEKQKIEFHYQKFGSTKKNKRVLLPYLLKEYKNRWYVLGVLDGMPKVTTFGLDRITDMKVIAGDFKKEVAFDQKKYFRHSFGITTPDEPVEKIVLQITGPEIHYIKSLPVHPTQMIIKETKSYVQIRIQVIPSYELYEFILSKCHSIKVISPASVRAEFKSRILKAKRNF